MAPMLPDCVPFVHGDLVLYVPLSKINAVVQAPGDQWAVLIAGDDELPISREHAVLLIGEGTIYNGPRPT